MGSLTYSLKKATKYYSKALVIYALLYIIGLVAGIWIFRNSRLEVEVQSYSSLQILWQNFRLCLILIVTGWVSLGGISGLILLFNGGILGFSLISIFNVYGHMPLVTGVLPHFFPEIIALLLACCISQETNKIWYNFRHKNQKVIRLKYNLLLFIILIVFLIIAAIIESIVTIRF